MKIEDANPELKQLTKQVFGVSEWLTSQKPIFDKGSGWYKCGKPIFAWFYVVGPRAKKHPANSILITATKSNAELEDASQKMGNNMFGENAPEFVARSNDPHNLAEFLEFIGRAYKARYPD
jgi:hypothetical protein